MGSLGYRNHPATIGIHPPTNFGGTFMSSTEDINEEQEVVDRGDELTPFCCQEQKMFLDLLTEFFVNEFLHKARKKSRRYSPPPPPQRSKRGPPPPPPAARASGLAAQRSTSITKNYQRQDRSSNPPPPTGSSDKYSSSQRPISSGKPKGKLS
ncbi:hypothetical protein KSP39_PZI007790 [Platanthera zijinensis]|uniref:Uncharacterized protein n=1 Tax=Platanthera zijinensis TaxID=2320716 RepID=A0AAP0G8Y1_9ASPA